MGPGSRGATGRNRGGDVDEGRAVGNSAGTDSAPQNGAAVRKRGDTVHSVGSSSPDSCSPSTHIPLTAHSY